MGTVYVIRQCTVQCTLHCTQYTVVLGDMYACVVFRQSLSCDYTAREDPRGLARLDYGFTRLSVKANIIGYTGEIVRKKVILLLPDFFFLPKVPSYLAKMSCIYL